MLVIAKEDVAIFKFIAFCSLITIQYNTIQTVFLMCHLHPQSTEFSLRFSSGAQQ